MISQARKADSSAVESRGQVLFVHISPGSPPSFIRRDLEILRSKFQVTPFFFRGHTDIPRLIPRIARHDVILSWFAWDNAFWSNRIASVLRRGTVTIAGGFDVVNMPEIGYGNLLHSGPRIRTRDALRTAKTVLAVSQSIANDATALSGREDIKVVYHGFDANQYAPPTVKQDLAMTAGEVSETNLARKGIRSFARAAESLPNIPFLIAGRVWDSALRLLNPVSPNVKFLGYLPDSKLLDTMRVAKVYVQASAHEGFGCALAEGMLCGCVPVVSHRGAIPEVVGNAGIYVNHKDPRDVARGVREALERPELGEAARSRIVSLFPLQKRRDELIRTIDRILITHD